MDHKRVLGASGIEVSPMGLGTWAWGDTGWWGYEKSFTRKDVDEAYECSLSGGITFLDTAEIYGKGESERIVGQLLKKENHGVKIASKFAPLPVRLNSAALLKALEASLKRLDIKKLDLYQIHWPYGLIPIEKLMDAMAEAVKGGLIEAVGISNFNEKQMRKAYARLSKYGIPLASNQVQYSLLHRTPQNNNVLQTCRELNVALIAYSPLAQGLLTGKYTGEKAEELQGMRRMTGSYRKRQQPRVQRVLKEVQTIAADRGKTPAQVSLNWLLTKDPLIIPIPGAKNKKQAEQNAGALGWQLTEQEMARLDSKG